jgi:hypothetical protein
MFAIGREPFPMTPWARDTGHDLISNLERTAYDNPVTSQS